MYSIWLLPSEKASLHFQNIINQLSEQFKTPTFEPHITLFTNIKKLTDEVFYKTSVLAALTTTFNVDLAELEISDSYFKSLFITIEQATTLQKLYQEIQNVFPTIDYDFQPHLSLFYSNEKQHTKAIILANLSNDLVGNFEANRLCIVETKEQINDWKIIETFNLHQSQNSHLDFINDTVKNLKI